jgi:hypothetical protein
MEMRSTYLKTPLHSEEIFSLIGKDHVDSTAPASWAMDGRQMLRGL